MSSLDLADFERSPAGERARARALEYATAQLSMAPQTMFPHPPLRAEAPRYWNVVLESAPLAEAIARLAWQRRTTMSVPVITAFAAIMATRASLPGALIYVTTSNRARPDWRAFTGAMAQDMMLHVPVPAAASFGDLSVTVQRAALMTYRYGHHDSTALRQCLARAGIRRGVRFDIPPWAAAVNVHMAATPTAPAASGYIEPYRSAPAYPIAAVQVAAPRIPWAGPRSDEENCAFFLDVFIEERRARLSAHIDTTVISVAESRSILRGIETVLAAFVDRDFLLSDIPVICPGIGRPIQRIVQVVDGSLVSVEDCRLALMRVPEVHEAGVRVDDATGSLIADVHLAGIPDPATLHRRVVSALEGHGLAVAPHYYRLYSACPRWQGEGWQFAPQALVASGRGR